MPPDDAEVQILLEIKQRGQEVFAEASFGLARVREALGKYREAEAAGLGVDRATKEALGDLMDRGMLAGVSFDVLKNQIQDARQALTHYSEAILAGMVPDAAEAAVLADLALQYQEVAVSADAAAGAQDAQAAAETAAAGGAAFAIPAFAGMALGIFAVATALVTLMPLILLTTGAIAVLTTFAVAGAGMVALLGAIGLGIGGLGAATLLLGIAGMGGSGAAAALATATANLQKAQQAEANFSQAHSGSLTITQQQQQARLLANLATAQQNYAAAVAASHSPISVFMADLKEMVGDFEKAAAPIAGEIIKWADKGLPAIEKIGMGILRWFGERVPGILQQLSRLFRDLAPDFQAFGQFLGAMFDRNESKLAPMAEQFIRFGLAVSEGLLSSLEQLSNWFEDRLPTYGPLVRSIMGGIGTAILGVATAVGKFADWVVKNWPTWTKEISDAWNNGAGAALETAWKTDLPQLERAFQDLMKNAPVWVPQLEMVAQAFLDIATATLSAINLVEKFEGLIGGAGNPPPPSSGRFHGAPGTTPDKTTTINNKITINGARSPDATARAVVRAMVRT